MDAQVPQPFFQRHWTALTSWLPPPLHLLLLVQDVEGVHEPVLKQAGQPYALATPHLLTSDAGFLGDLRLCFQACGRGIILTKGAPLISCSYPLKLMLMYPIKTDDLPAGCVPLAAVLPVTSGIPERRVRGAIEIGFQESRLVRQNRIK
jgi:hypothetical protein